MPSTTNPTNLGIPGLPTITPLNTSPTNSSYLQAPNFTPDQMGIQNRLAQMGQQRIENPSAGFLPFENRAREQFARQTVPSLAERFTAFGGDNQRSSAFTGALGQAGADLESQLSQNAAQYGLQNQQFGLNLAQAGLQPQYNQTYYQPNDSSNNLGNNLAHGGVSLLESYLRAPGNGFGEKLSSMLGVPSGVTAAAAPLIGDAVTSGINAVRGSGSSSSSNTLPTTGTTTTGRSTANDMANQFGVSAAGAAAKPAIDAIADSLKAGAAPSGIKVGPAGETMEDLVLKGTQSGLSPAASAVAADLISKSPGVKTALASGAAGVAAATGIPMATKTALPTVPMAVAAKSGTAAATGMAKAAYVASKMVSHFALPVTVATLAATILPEIFGGIWDEWIMDNPPSAKPTNNDGPFWADYIQNAVDWITGDSEEPKKSNVVPNENMTKTPMPPGLSKAQQDAFMKEQLRKTRAKKKGK